MGERGGWLLACSSEFRQCETCVEGSAESWRGCHNSGRESPVMLMPAARLVQMASAVRDPRVVLWGNSSGCLSYVTAQQGNEAGGTRRGAHVRGICAFIKCGCVHSVWFVWNSYKDIVMCLLSLCSACSKYGNMKISMVSHINHTVCIRGK